MSTTTITGKVLHIGQTESRGANGNFKTRRIVIEDKSNELRPQWVPIDFIYEKGDLLDDFNVDDTVTIGAKITSRPKLKDGKENYWSNYTYFMNLQGFKIEPAQVKSPSEDMPTAAPADGAHEAEAPENGQLFTDTGASGSRMDEGLT